MQAELITRIKNVTNKKAKIGGKSAYLEYPNGSQFLLHFPNRFRKRITDSSKDELIVLYQRMGPKNKRFLTHIVKPIDNDEAEDKNSNDENYKYGRYVEVLAFANDKIPYDKTLLKELNFRNKGWGNAVTFEDEKFVNPKHLKKYQKHLLSLFKNYSIYK